MRSATLGDSAVKLVEVSVEIIHVDGNPFHDVDILWEHDDSLEIPFDQGSIDEWTGQIQWFWGWGTRSDDGRWRDSVYWRGCC